MIGMNAITGDPIEEMDHLQQSIRDILTTPIGSRVMRRNYGSRLLELIDQPANDDLKLELYAATAEALQEWEPRLKLDQVEASIQENGKITLFLSGTYVPTANNVELSIEL